MTDTRSPTIAHEAMPAEATPVEDATLGILMLQTRFERVHGDIGNPRTWPFPVLYHVVPGASAGKVVLDEARGLLPAFIDGARELVDRGAQAITTSCGFLSLFQHELAAAAGVPVATSSLMQVPWVQAMLPPGRRVGVVTASAASLTAAHLRAAGAAEDTPVTGIENGRELYRVLVLGAAERIDAARAQQDVLDAGTALLARHPEVGAIVLECTNMPPYAAALRRRVGVPVFDIHSMIRWFHAGLRPRVFDARRAACEDADRPPALG